MTSSINSSDKPTPFETILAEEAGEIDEIAALTTRLQDKRALTDKKQEGKLLRGVHPKSHGCVEVEFTINKNIADEHKVGMFAIPGKTYKAWIRFSNASVLREDDLKVNDKGKRENGSRGMAIKVMGVEGDMLELDNGASNQDFLLINTPEFAFANVRDYLRLERILDQDALGANPKPYFFPAALAQLGEPKEGEPAEDTDTRQFLKKAVAMNPLLNSLSAADLKGTFASAGVARKILSSDQTVRNPLQVPYFSAAPFLFGAGRIMKFSVVPCESVPQDPFVNATADEPPEDYLREALIQTIQGEKALTFNFKIAVRSIDEDGLNIEDATTSWDSELGRYTNVARITIAVPQNVEDTAAIGHCERLAFSPWHSLADHQPLGGINRLRRKVYDASARHRCATEHQRKAQKNLAIPDTSREV